VEDVAGPKRSSRFQKQSKLVKTHTRYKIRYMPEKPLLISSAEKNANQGRSIRRNGRLVGTRTPNLYRVKGQLTNTLNNLESDGDRLSTPKYA
jgi:hypothetical protein